MRVCFIEDTSLRGGSQIWVAEAIRFLRSHGVAVTLITQRDGWNAVDARNADVDLVSYDANAVRKSAAMQRVWIDALAECDIALCTVHPPRDGFHCSVFAAKCIADAGLQTVLMPKAGTIVPSYERQFYVPVQPIHYHVIAITGFTRDYLLEHYRIPAHSVSLVYQGTDITRFKRSEARAAHARERFQLRADASPVLGCVGSFERRKGQRVLLEAVELLRRQLPELLLLLVGDGPDESMLEQAIADKGLDHNVSVVPFTSDPEQVFELIDILVLASLCKEGLPNVLLESLAMEIPAVSTRLAGTPEVIIDGQTGYLVEPGNADALANAIARLWSDQVTYHKMASTGRAMMTERFDKQQQFKQFLNVFNHVLARR